LKRVLGGRGLGAEGGKGTDKSPKIGSADKKRVQRGGALRTRWGEGECGFTGDARIINERTAITEPCLPGVGGAFKERDIADTNQPGSL